jgi:type IV pilus assembly protein PilE
MVRGWKTGCRRGLRQAQCGFTMIEVLLVVALVAVLAAVAIPSYTSYLVRGQRSAAKVALVQAAAYMERSYTSNGCYNFSTPQGCQGGGGAVTTLLPGFNKAPTDGSTQSYVITLAFSNAAAPVQDYRLTATPCGDSGAGCPTSSNQGFTDPDCDVLTLNNAGARTATGTVGSARPELCWSR